MWTQWIFPPRSNRTFTTKPLDFRPNRPRIRTAGEGFFFNFFWYQSCRKMNFFSPHFNCVGTFWYIYLLIFLCCCADVLMCCVDDMLMCWCVYVLMCWCGVLMCWDVIVMMRRVDVMWHGVVWCDAMRCDMTRCDVFVMWLWWHVMWCNVMWCDAM